MKAKSLIIVGDGLEVISKGKTTVLHQPHSVGC